jgi:hypothetical protein
VPTAHRGKVLQETLRQMAGLLSWENMIFKRLQINCLASWATSKKSGIWAKRQMRFKKPTQIQQSWQQLE